MNRLFIGLSGVILAISVLGCRTQKNTSISESRPAASEPGSGETNAALEAELEKLIKAGETANAEAERIADASSTNGSLAEDDLQKTREAIRAKLEAVRQGCLDFISRHPSYGDGYAAYGDFLLGHYDELGAQAQLEKALDLDARTPTVYNDLANIYGHRGDVKEAFNCYAKAIDLDPTETIYYQNFATTVFLFRKDAREYYNIDEQQVFDKALLLYSNAMRLDPTNFALAVDVAKSYYGIKPWRFDDAMRGWTNALNLAHTDAERQEVCTHFARIQIQAGNYDRAQQFLEQVNDPQFAALKNRMLKTIQTRKSTGA